MRYLYLLLALALVCWASVFPDLPADQHFMFWRRQGLWLSGLVAIVLMGGLMLLALRPRWLEQRLGGLDHLFRLHKWCGIGAGIAVLLHWLIANLPGWLVDAGWLVLPAHPPRPPNPLRWWAVHAGEWCFYAMVAFIAVSLIRRVPYRRFRQIHRLGAVLFLMGAFHSIYFIPNPMLWSTAFSALILLAGVGGGIAALFSLSGHIGKARRLEGKIAAIRRPHRAIVEIDVVLERPLENYQPGQFVFLNLNPHEGDHPFTIVSCSPDRRRLGFAIKALGDYTRDHVPKLKLGDALSVQGPYGGFTLPAPAARAYWLGGGIGITPFLAWLEALVARGERRPQTTLCYCIGTYEDAIFAERLQQLCALTGIVLRLVVRASEGRFHPDKLSLDAQTHVWFCGPPGLRKLLQKFVPGRLLHYEQFEFR